MQAPFIFITTHAINDGRREDYLVHLREVREFIEANEPSMLDFQIYMDDSETQVTFVRVFPDAAAADVHLQALGEHIGRGLELTTTSRLEVYGTPGPVLEQVLGANAEHGVPLSIKPNHRGGFSRTAVHRGTDHR
jgi:quinol monooxygenase YgiN